MKRIGILFVITFLTIIVSMGHCGPRPLKADTATAVLVGPFLDATDGVTEETVLTVSAISTGLYKFSNTHPLTRIEIPLTAAAGNNDCAHVANGYYSMELTASNLDTEGEMQLTFSYSTFLPTAHDFVVLNANVYDSLYAPATTDYLQTDVTQIATAAVATGTAQLGVNVVNYAGNAAVATVAGHPDVNIIYYNASTAIFSVAGHPDVNVTYWEDDAVPATADGYPGVNVDEWDDTDVAAVRAGHPEVNVIYYNASTAIFTVAGYPDVNVTHWEDSAITDADGQPDVDVVSLGNNVITSASINDGGITDADVANDVQVDVVTIETGDATNALDTACDTSTVTSIGANVITDASMAADVDTLVNDEVADVLKTDTVSEMAQGAPSGTPSMEDILNYLYRAWRNQVITSSSSQAYYNDAADTVLFRNPVSDDGNEFTKGEVVTGP